MGFRLDDVPFLRRFKNADSLPVHVAGEMPGDVLESELLCRARDNDIHHSAGRPQVGNHAILLRVARIQQTAHAAGLLFWGMSPTEGVPELARAWFSYDRRAQVGARMFSPRLIGFVDPLDRHRFQNDLIHLRAPA